MIERRGPSLTPSLRFLTTVSKHGVFLFHRCQTSLRTRIFVLAWRASKGLSIFSLDSCAGFIDAYPGSALVCHSVCEDLVTFVNQYIAGSTMNTSSETLPTPFDDGELYDLLFKDLPYGL